MTGSSDNTRRVRSDVLIIGAGIAGSALACALRGTNLAVCLLEKREGPLDTARGDHLRPRTVEILEEWEVLPRFLAAGAEQRRGSEWYADDGAQLLASTFSGLDLPHPYYLYLDHECIGEVLLEAALESDRVSIERPIRNWWLERQTANGVTVRATLANGDEVLIDASLVVGADGRNSKVRKAFGFAAQLHTYERPIAIFFARDAQRDTDNNLRVHLSPNSTVVVIPRTGGECKIGVPVAADAARELRRASDSERVAWLQSSAPFLEVSEIRYADLYPPVYLRATSWAEGNVVLLGDACHAMHPARSQGMNITIECIDVLREGLETATPPLTAATACRVLASYEARLKQRTELLLEKNHADGLKMDRIGEEAYAATCGALRHVQSDERLARALALDAAGYG